MIRDNCALGVRPGGSGDIGQDLRVNIILGHDIGADTDRCLGRGQHDIGGRGIATHGAGQTGQHRILDHNARNRLIADICRGDGKGQGLPRCRRSSIGGIGLGDLQQWVGVAHHCNLCRGRDDGAGTKSRLGGRIIGHKTGGLARTNPVKIGLGDCVNRRTNGEFPYLQFPVSRIAGNWP